MIHRWRELATNEFSCSTSQHPAQEQKQPEARSTQQLPSGPLRQPLPKAQDHKNDKGFSK